MSSKTIARIEAQFQKPVAELLQEYIDQSATKARACDDLNVSRGTLLRLLKEYKLVWPIYTKEYSEIRREARREDTIYHVEHEGDVKPLFQAAAECGISYKVLLMRYKNGDRGERLFRKVRKYKRSGGNYNLNLTVRDCKQLRQMALEMGKRQTAVRTGIPYGAITLAMKGQYERLG